MIFAFGLVLLIIICLVTLMYPVIGAAVYFCNLVVGLSIRYPELIDLRIMGILPMFILLSIFMKRGKVLNKKQFPQRYEIYFLVFHLSIWIGWIYYYGFNLFKSNFLSLLVPITLFFFCSRFIYSEKGLRILIGGLVGGIVFIAFEGLYQIIYPDIISLDSVRFEGTVRFSNSNEQALIMNIALPFLLFVFSSKDDFGIKKTTNLFFLFVTTLITIQTASRAGFLGYITICVLFFAKTKKIKNVLFSIIIVVFFLLILLPDSNLSNRTSATNATGSLDASSADRLEAWWAARVMFKQHPIIGVGQHNFMEHHTLMAHNSFFLVLAETGIFGTICWVMLIVSGIKTLRRIDRIETKNTENITYLKGIAHCNLVALYGFLVTSSFGNQCYSPFLFLLLSLPYSIERLIEYEQNVVNKEC